MLAFPKEVCAKYAVLCVLTVGVTMPKDNEQRNKHIREMRKQGALLEDLARDHGLSQSSVQKICNGIQPEKTLQIGRLSDEEVFSHIAPYLERTKSAHVISQYAGIGYTRVCDVMQKYGYDVTAKGPYRAPTTESMQSERNRVDALMAERGGYEDDPRACRPERRMMSVASRSTTFRSSANF